MKGETLTKLIIGGFLIFLGLGFFADQIPGFNFGRIISIFWPVVIMLIGLYIILKTKSQFIIGSIVFLAGTLWLVDQFVDLPFSIWNLWPLVLIYFGLRIIFPGKLGDFNRMSNHSTEGESFESTAVFWGDSRKVKSDNFKSGKVTAMFGGNEIDLRDVKVAKEGADIEIVAMFGGVSIKVNENTLVKSDGLGIFGGFGDKTAKPAKPEGTITIKGSAIFGGVEIKN